MAIRTTRHLHNLHNIQTLICNNNNNCKRNASTDHTEVL